MAHTKKISDQGWFYHAPSKPKPRTGPVPVPPISQIPGLSNVSHLPEEDPCKRMWLRDTDSEYVKLAKQGGRQDLLTMMPSKPLSDQPVGYPRCEWFYDSYSDPNPPTAPEKPYEFLLPSYMVHEPLKPCVKDGCAAFNPEQDTGFGADDKTVKIREGRSFGYRGARVEKREMPPSYKAIKYPCKGTRKR